MGEAFLLDKAAEPFLPDQAGAGAEAILRSAWALREAGLRDDGLVMLETRLQCFRSVDQRASRELASGYIRMVTFGIDRSTQLQRGEENPFLLVLDFARRNSWLLEEDFLWFDRLLRANRGMAIETRIGLWSLVLDSEPRDMATVLTVLSLAANARDFGVMGRAATQLQPFLQARLAQCLAEDVPHWCQVGDVRLMENALEAAEPCYRTALAMAPGDARALLGLACLQLDRGLPWEAAALGRQASESFAKAGKAEAAHIVATLTGFWGAAPESRPVESFEVVIFCHVTNKLERNAHMGAPGIALVEASVGTLRSVVGIGPEIPITLYYDHRETEMNEAFSANLLRFCAAQGVSLVINTRYGLRRQWLHAFSRSRADVIMVVEQDHEFLAPGPKPREVAELFRRRPDIGHLRFNRRRNRRMGFDMMLMQTARDRDDAVCRTGGFSNQPHFIRRDYYDAIVHPAIRDNPHHDARNFGAAGVEENVNNIMQRMEPLVGMPAMLRLFGLAIWGHPGGNATIRHLGV